MYEVTNFIVEGQTSNCFAIVIKDTKELSLSQLIRNMKTDGETNA